jgi:hypothetical protein
MKALKVLSILSLGLIGTIPPHDLTVTRMGIAEVRIREYWSAHGHLPASLEELALLKGRDNETIDGWGRPIQYVVTAPSTVTLTSLGADGGTDPSRKIEVTFQADKPQV